jgi:uncharacterized protein YjcR
MRKKKVKPAPKTRKSYGDDVKGEAKDLYLKGLNLERICKYLAVPVRTLQKWQLADHWTELKNPAAAVLELQKQKFSIRDIAARLEMSEKSVKNMLKVQAAENPASKTI